MLTNNTFEELQIIDALLFQKQWQRAYDAFISMLDNLAIVYANKNQIRDFHHGAALDEAAEICQRASFQWQLLLQSELVFSQVNIGPVLSNLPVLHSLIMGTYRGNLDDFIVAYHVHRNGQYNKEGLLRQLLAWCPNTRSGFNPFIYYQHCPDVVLAQAVACLVDIALVGEKANQARHDAIEFLLSGQPKPELLSKYKGFNLVPIAWMRSSYADDARKHQVKPFLTHTLERMTSLPKSFLLPTSPRLKDGRPVLFIPLEGMKRDHAMYRCYAELIQSCRQHFYTVGLGVDAMWDEAVAALFDHFELVENSADSGSLGKAFEQVQKIITGFAPAMVWFPSVGMDRWIILLANRRMAPLQVMTLGHPATSMSPEMDALLVEQDMIGDSSCYSEVSIPMPDGSARYLLPATSAPVTPLRRLPEDGVIRIAIPSVAQKLTAAFVRCLSEVQARAVRPVEFVFFTGEAGVSHAAAAHNLLRELKHATVHNALLYPDYIREINRCQIHACTFPFGGTNSLLDSLRQGLPLVALEGKEVHARIDAVFIRRAGLPENLICHSEEEYVDCLLRLVEHPDEILRLHHYLLSGDSINNVFMHTGTPELFADQLYHLHQSGREKLQAMRPPYAES